jgi:selenide,water dikinase
MIRPGHIQSDIVLVGGGHAHVHVLKAFAMRPEPGVRLTLVARDLETPYSGMLPGVVANLYTREQAEIDLVRLATATGARLLHAEAIGLDRERKRVQLAGRAPIAYDVLSIDVGVVPDLANIKGAAEHGIAVKPIGSFLDKFDLLVARCKLAGGPRRIAIIGGGAGGVELLLSVRTRLLSEVAAVGSAATEFSFSLITSGEILETHNRRVADAFRRVFAQRGVKLYEHGRVRALTPSTVEFDNAPPLEIDAALVTTDAAGPRWLRDTGLALSSGGFIATRPSLQTLNDPNVFAAGDCAALNETPREKAGVFAVRAGPPLAENLRRHVRDVPLKAWHPQRRHLALISTGERYAVASRGPFKAEGVWVWRWKDWIDRRWMRMYQNADHMMAQMSGRQHRVYASGSLGNEMRCGGCGAKIGPQPLARVLARLSPARAKDIIVGLDAPDDAAVTVPPEGKMLVQTIDFFPAFIDDPYLLGEIAANHGLNDIFAMGGVPRHALATAVVPPGTSSKVEEELFQLLAGARACLDREDVALIGGHSSEGALAIGFAITGEVAPDRIVRKSGLKIDDALVLTRPLGTGILFAAAKRAHAKAPWIDAALVEMRNSNRAAAELLIAHGANAMTDISGFGLVGHLGELLVGSGASATLDQLSVPLYEGVLTLARKGVSSTLLAENLARRDLLRGEFDAPTQAVLFDPQTSGGLLAGIPSDRAAACVAELRANGYSHATIIGRVVAAGSPASRVTVRARGEYDFRDDETGRIESHRQVVDLGEEQIVE